MRDAGHADFARCPSGEDALVTIRRRVAAGTTIEPINHGFGSERFIVQSHGRTAQG
jgi:hypothetical protein